MYPEDVIIVQEQYKSNAKRRSETFSFARKFPVRSLERILAGKYSSLRGRDNGGCEIFARHIRWQF